MEVCVEKTISVLLANDFPLVGCQLRDLLNSFADMRVVALAKRDDELVPLIKTQRPLVCIIDLELKWPVLVDLVQLLAKRPTSILVISDIGLDDNFLELLVAGAMGIISPRATPDLFCRSIRAVARGEIWVSRKAITRLIQELRMQRTHATSPTQQQEHQLASNPPAGTKRRMRDYGLTPRELEVLCAIGAAMSNKDIAAQLGISEYTVKHHLTKIFDKVGVDTRLELAMTAAHYGLVIPDRAVV